MCERAKMIFLVIRHILDLVKDVILRTYLTNHEFITTSIWRIDLSMNRDAVDFHSTRSLSELTTLETDFVPFVASCNLFFSSVNWSIAFWTLGSLRCFEWHDGSVTVTYDNKSIKKVMYFMYHLESFVLLLKFTFTLFDRGWEARFNWFTI